MNELKDLAKRLVDMKPSLKTLRDRAKQQLVASGQEDEEPDLQRIARKCIEFRALPASTKLAAFLDDAAMLRLMLLAMFLGMLLMLGILIEGFSYKKCRFVCAG